MTDTHEPARCARTPGLLADRDDGRLASSRRASLDEHLAGCAACAELALDWDEARQALALLRPQRGTDADVAAVMAAVDAAAGAPIGAAASDDEPTGDSSVDGAGDGAPLAPVLSLDEERAAYRRALHAAAGMRGPSTPRRIAAGLLVALLGAAAGVLLWLQLDDGRREREPGEALVVSGTRTGAGAGAGAGTGAVAGAGAVADAVADAGTASPAPSALAARDPSPDPVPSIVLDVQTEPLVEFAREVWADARGLMLAALAARPVESPSEPSGQGDSDVDPALVAVADGGPAGSAAPAAAEPVAPAALPDEPSSEAAVALADPMRPLQAGSQPGSQTDGPPERQPVARPRERRLASGFAGGPAARGEVVLLRDDGGLTLAFSATRSGEVRDYRDEVPALLTLLEHDEADVVALARARLEVLRSEAERLPGVGPAVERGLALEAERALPSGWSLPSFDRREVPAEERTLLEAWALWWSLAEPLLPSTPDQGAD
jgi:hypothetical protein